MEQRVSLITLGVADLARAQAFYAALGWQGHEVDETVFFDAGSHAIVLWGRDKLAADAGVADPAGTGTGTGVDGFGGIVLAHNVRTPAEVDAVCDNVRAAGGTVTREPAATFYGGYAGYFADPDGHLWEVAHNPGFALGPDGALILPNFGDGDSTP
jgi:uncharacterized protein